MKNLSEFLDLAHSKISSSLSEFSVKMFLSKKSFAKEVSLVLHEDQDNFIDTLYILYNAAVSFVKIGASMKDDTVAHQEVDSILVDFYSFLSIASGKMHRVISRHSGSDSVHKNFLSIVDDLKAIAGRDRKRYCERYADEFRKDGELHFLKYMTDEDFKILLEVRSWCNEEIVVLRTAFDHVKVLKSKEDELIRSKTKKSESNPGTTIENMAKKLKEFTDLDVEIREIKDRPGEYDSLWIRKEKA